MTHRLLPPAALLLAIATPAMADRDYIVKYKLPDDQIRAPRVLVVQANSEPDAAKVARAMIPSAVILGSPQRATNR